MMTLRQLALTIALILCATIAHAQTAPTLVSYTETASWVVAATTKSTASVSWQTGDILVVMSGSEGATGTSRLGTPTATGLTFTKRASNITNSTCEAYTATAVAASTSSSAVTCTSTVSQKYGCGVWVWRTSAGIGNNAEQHTATKTRALTPVGAHSAIMWGIFDFNAEAVHAITPAATNTRQAVQSAPEMSTHVADLIDQASAGSVSYGISGGSSTGPYTIVIQEVQGAASGGATCQSRTLMGVGCDETVPFGAVRDRHVLSTDGDRHQRALR